MLKRVEIIREERDPAFWQAVAEHPAVAPHIALGGQLPDLAAAVVHPSVTPLAAEHGGFLFFRLDGVGRVYELHTLFTPEGWGREVARSSKAAFDRVFSQGAQIVTTFEVAGWWRSKPPLSHGWKAAGPFAYVPELAAEVRSWILTREAFEASPARRRTGCP